jgi:2'-5' RNA ligase
VDHVVAVLDPDHSRVVTELSEALAAELGIGAGLAVPRRPHITIASYEGVEPSMAAAALAPVARELTPFAVRAHGYGVFAGDADSDLSLHVAVVRTRALDRLHARVHDALGRAGAEVAGTTGPAAWTPHITLLDRGLTPRLLGRSVELLTCRPHRSWSVPIDALTVTRRGDGTGPGGARVPLGAG